MLPLLETTTTNHSDVNLQIMQENIRLLSTVNNSNRNLGVQVKFLSSLK